MNLNPRLLAATFLLLAPALLLAQEAPRSPRALAQAIEAVLEDEAFDNAFWAAVVVNLDTREVLYARNQNKSLIPASNVKLYTAAAALDLLGPDYRYRTGVYIDGPVVGGTLRGNLIIRGSGDPTIGGRFHEDDRTAVFRTWADSLRALGITHIDGDIIGDDDVFDDVPLGYGWSWDDELYAYSAEVSGLSFNDNNVDFTIEGQRPGMPARVTWEPFNTDYVEVVNSTLTLHPDSSLKEGYARARGTNTIHLFSQVPAGRQDLESLTVTNPTLFFTHVLRAALLQAGIAVAGRPVDVDDLPIKPDYQAPHLQRVAVYTSPPLADIVQVINKHTHNLYAEQVLKTLAAERPRPETEHDPGSAAMGIEVAMETLVQAGLDTSRIQLVDGSGLARQNLVTAEMTATLLQYMYYHPRLSVRAAFYESLPVGGLDGTLQFRFPYGRARGNVRAKTGTLSNISALSGYVTSAGGTPLAFVLMCNHYTVQTARVREAQDAIINLLGHYRR